MRTRMKKDKEDEQRTYGEVRQWLIDKYRVDHFDSILSARGKSKIVKRLRETHTSEEA
jgi:hypothetical protein